LWFIRSRKESRQPSQCSQGVSPQIETAGKLQGIDKALTRGRQFPFAQGKMAEQGEHT
jgi:hypothetical protein